MPKLRNAYKLLDADIRAENVRALRYWLKEQYYQVRRPRMSDPVFVTGCCRSGTTVVCETLAASPQLRYLGYATPEFWSELHGPAHNNWDSQAATATDADPRHRLRALAYFYARLGRGRILDKTCIHILRIPYLLALFPQSRFVCVFRDGRDNIGSLMDAWRARGPFGLRSYLGEFPERVAIDDGRFDEWMLFLPPGWRGYNRSPLSEVCAFQWITANTAALEARALVPEGQWIEVRYEDLFERPVDVFEDVFTRLGLRFDDAMRERANTIAQRPTSLVRGTPMRQKWRQHNREAIEGILDSIRPMMQRLHYSLDS